MSQNSAIEWTESTWNPVRGCVKVSPGCANCYAETFAERWRGVPGHAYEQGFDLRLVPEKLDEPLRRKKPTTYFVNSMSDLFQDGVPDEFIGRVFDVMAQARRHTFQVLTKRADRMRAVVSSLASGHTARDGSGWPLPNVWLGVSVENQHFADERIPLLLQTPAAVRFISAEPLLGPLNFRWAKWDDWSPSTRRKDHSPSITRDGKTLAGCVDELDGLRMLDWVIPGFESGANARPGQVAWIRSIVQQCAAAGVACFVKQLGAKPIDRNDAGFEGDTPTSWPMDTDVIDNPRCREEYQGAPVRVRLAKKGGDPTEWPEDLRVREMPRAG